MPVVKDSIKNDLGEDVTIYIEVSDDSLDEEEDEYNGWDNTRGVVTASKKAFDQATTLIRACAANIAQSVTSIDSPLRPTEFEVQLSIKIDNKVGAVIAETTTGAQLQVTLKWCERKA